MHQLLEEGASRPIIVKVTEAAGAEPLYRASTMHDPTSEVPVHVRGLATVGLTGPHRNLLRRVGGVLLSAPDSGEQIGGPWGGAFCYSGQQTFMAFLVQEH